ncbi:MAG TPA: response regulator [Nitrososphaeraceae archaeon]|jgi:DNA-binding response OmpR family regulator|nr:response regulator [Nitrososphaeraceae archaeon]
MRILLVDDEPDITLPFRIGLEDSGFEVDAFNDSVMALSKFKDRSYVLALLDIKMPKMNGFELYNELRKINEKLKVCFITAFDVQKEDLKALSELNGNLAIIRKPIAIGDLVKKVKLELGSNQA